MAYDRVKIFEQANTYINPQTAKEYHLKDTCL